MNRNPVFAVIALTFAMFACQTVFPTQPQTETYDLGCHETIAAVNALKSGLKFPEQFGHENPAKQGNEFDPNHYFEVFKTLQMQDGYTLDFVYHQDGMGGYPVLYARPIGQPPYITEADYAVTTSGDRPDYLSFVVPQDNPRGYFEYAAFAVLANQFYLSWHANYNDWKILCDREEVDAIIQSLDGEHAFGVPMTAKQKKEARSIDNPQPSVNLNAETATVTMLVFTKWGGFYQREFTIRRADHSILDVQDTPLVEYECGIMF